MVDVLPDSRLKSKKGAVIADWTFNGKTIRLELEPIFCFNCGKANGYVPAETMSFVSWLCNECSMKWGKEASLHTHADEEFWKAVHYEMVKRWGRGLTQEELYRMAEQDQLGTSLKLLEKESPYKGVV